MRATIKSVIKIVGNEQIINKCVDTPYNVLGV